MIEIEKGHPLPDIDVDWVAIRTLWEAGASIGYITKRYPVGRGLVESMSAVWDQQKREAAVLERGMNGSVPAGRLDAEVVGERGVQSSVEGWLNMIAKIRKPGWDQESFPLYEVAETLHNVASGMPVSLAAEAAGLTDRGAMKYRALEPRLDTLFRKARAVSAAPLVKKIMEDRDWRAAAWLLERGIAKAEFKQEAVGKDDKLTIEIMVSREDKAALANVIDVTESANAPMVAGLPAIGEAEDLPRS